MILILSILTRIFKYFSRKFGPRFLEVADYMIGSPTALADRDIEASLEAAADNHGLYIPSGALWGGEDIRKMAERGTLTGPDRSYLEKCLVMFPSFIQIFVNCVYLIIDNNINIRTDCHHEKTP